MQNLKNHTDATKMRIRRGYYGTHKHVLSEQKLNEFTDDEVAYYKSQADLFDERDKNRTIIGWCIALIAGIIVIGFFVVSGANQSSSSQIHTGENNSNNATSPEPDNTTPMVDTTVPAEPPTSDDSSSECNPNYSGCVENSSYDLDCRDVGQRVSVIGDDVYNLDGDGDGIGCESY